MKKTSILIILILVCRSGFTQDQRAKDSLRKVIQTTIVDTARVMALRRLSFVESQPSLRLELAYKALDLSKKIKWLSGEAQCYLQLTNCYRNISDFPNALANALKSLKKYEEIGNPEGIGVAFGLIGGVCLAQERYQGALIYLSKAEEFYRKVPMLSADNRGIQYMQVGSVYVKMERYDSALIYYNRAYEIIPKTNVNLAAIYIGLADVYTANKELDLAQSYYKKAIDAARKRGSQTLANAYLKYALYFDKTNQRDSAIYYAQQSIERATQIDQKSTLVKTATLLSTLYEKTDANEALKYHKIAAQTKDSIFSQATSAKLQSMEYAERERQQELGELERVQKEERQHNLQYAAIALVLVTFVIFFFLLSHSVIANQKVISFLGILALLIVFEFLNLLLHPFLDRITNHQPVLMLTAMVCIAALLIPLHHKLEHWITHKMVEKNKKIRLAAAKKTIAKLEGEQTT